MFICAAKAGSRCGLSGGPKRNHVRRIIRGVFSENIQLYDQGAVVGEIREMRPSGSPKKDVHYSHLKPNPVAGHLQQRRIPPPAMG
jgi:hypothetical protein